MIVSTSQSHHTHGIAEETELGLVFKYHYQQILVLEIMVGILVE